MNRVIRKIENFLQTESGQRFLQYAYSFGAAIVIFGAMVKVLHLWGVWGNIIFGTGMALECIVFVLYGLDRPAKGVAAYPMFENENASAGSGNTQSGAVVSGLPTSGTTHVVFHGTPQSQSQPTATPQSARGIEHIDPQNSDAADAAVVGQLSAVSGNVRKFADATETLTKISESLQESYKYIIDNSQNISQNSLGYVQQMEALNRNISGLNTIYEIQLKSISGQIDTIEQINGGLSRIKNMYNDTVPDGSVIKEETEKMAEQLRELNQVYARMLDAMTNSQPASQIPKNNA